MSREKKQFALVVDGRELATILAALRFHQDENLRAGPDPRFRGGDVIPAKAGIPDQAINDIASNSGSLEPLDFKDVNTLCERINTCYEVPTRRKKNDWVVVVTDKCRVVHVRAYGSKTAAREGLFKYLRECREYNGRENLLAVRQWVSNRNELLGVDIVRQDISDTSG